MKDFGIGVDEHRDLVCIKGGEDVVRFDASRGDPFHNMYPIVDGFCKRDRPPDRQRLREFGDDKPDPGPVQT